MNGNYGVVCLAQVVLFSFVLCWGCGGFGWFRGVFMALHRFMLIRTMMNCLGASSLKLYGIALKVMFMRQGKLPYFCFEASSHCNDCWAGYH